MNNQAVANQDKSAPAASREKSVSTLNSTDALAMLEHGGELTMGITTPVGTTFRCKSTFIGAHSKNFVLAELPKISDNDLDFFFQPGFWTTIRAISHRGEGAIVHFRSQLEHVLTEPIPMVALAIPNAMQVTQLRKEPRYDVNLPASVKATTHKLDCQIRDLSKSGCRFVTAPLSRAFQIGDEIALEIRPSIKKSNQFEPLFGKICNLQSSLHYARYGVQFDENGTENAKQLLANLKFDGTKLTLR
ncbi:MULTISPECIES: flagellar brake protein [Vibrio]|uniref:flagellar brake protein n=1 Tax=Vibrio TaxID=662 RepID=UPI002075AC68|nr:MULTISPECIES: flagellar brake protein [Vibrio]USD34920.1 flagellar brake protein [Vibrio sp. SCSIO 43186]USD47985.1 flagellar brake protein [Vibrio sp. SCSIO 43145]USD72044.1 flagellar brake protein [Vibrio sp. SCSIO 43139]USD97714.1 cation tolerance protein CutA [Vibrio coralliilyticus]